MERRHLREALENILRLRHAERLAGADVRAEIASVREFLEDMVGPTVRPADAARALGVSHPALHHWLQKGEIATVTTPHGRREIPLSELVELLEEVEEGREDSGRPLSRVIRERHRRSAEAIDLDRLLPRKRRRTHRTPELHALAYHRLLGERLDDRIVDQARRRLHRWRRDDRIDPRWAEQWEQLLAMPLTDIKKAISSDTVRGRELRQTSPFAGVLTEQERRLLHKAVEERAFT